MYITHYAHIYISLSSPVSPLSTGPLSYPGQFLFCVHVCVCKCVSVCVCSTYVKLGSRTREDLVFVFLITMIVFIQFIHFASFRRTVHPL